MGDDLLDDYWVEEIIADEEEPTQQQQQQQQHSNDKPSQQQKKKKKTKNTVKTSVENQQTNDKDVADKDDPPDGEDTKEKKVKKKKLKRKSENTPEILEPASKKKKKKKKPGKGQEVYEPTLEAMWTFFESELKKSLSDIEVADLKPEANDWFLTETTDPITRTDITNFPKYLTNIVPTWTQECETLTKSATKGSPLMLIVTSSAVRAVELLRHTAPFKGESCKTSKLFAKHFKVDEQSKNLKEKVVHLAVGTPHRVVALMENGSLRVERLKYVVVDWSWKDVKMRGLTNMPMVKESFVQLFQQYLLGKCGEGSLSVGVF
jgi:protein CMS1